MADKQQVFQWLEEHAGEMQEFLSSLIQIPSYSGEEYNVQQKVKTAMEAAGLSVAARAYDEEQVRPNVLGTYQGTGKGEGLLLVAHSDTVTVPTPDEWVHGPFSGDFDGTWIHGRGAGDDKWGITAALFAVRALKECGVSLSGDVHVLSSVGEEAGVENRKTYGAGPMVRDMENKPTFCVVCEGSNMEICPETPCSLKFELTVPGKATHGCLRRNCIYPQPHNVYSGTKEGVDALQKALPIIEALYRLERDLSIDYDRGGLLGSGGTDMLNKQGVGAFTICPSKISGGTGVSVIGGITLTYGADFPATYTHEEVFDIIKKTVDGVADSDRWLREHRPIVTLVRETHGFRTDASLPAVATMRKAFQDAMGRPGIVSSWIAQCDGDAISPYVPCVIFGPQPPNTHAPNERITLREVVDCAKVFASTAMEHCK